MQLKAEIIDMVANDLRKGGRFKSKTRSGFSLIELLTVIMIMATMMAISAPVVQSLKGNGDFGQSVDEVSGTLSQARAYAMAHSTYVWVGFYEEDYNAAVPTQTLPPYSGTGKVVVGIVASLDGTKIFEEDAAAAVLPSSRIKAVGKLKVLGGVHLADVDAVTGTGNPLRLQGRPDLAYSEPNAEQSRISSESANSTPFPFEMQKYSFYKTVRFSPGGEVSINGIYQPKRIGEIGLMPTRGNRVGPDEQNIAAIQISGIGGNIQVYRQ